MQAQAQLLQVATINFLAAHDAYKAERHALNRRKRDMQGAKERLSNGAADLQIEKQLVGVPKAVAIDRRDGESGVALPLQPVLSPEQQILPEEEDAAKLWLLSLEQTASGSYPTSSGAMMSIAKMVTL